MRRHAGRVGGGRVAGSRLDASRPPAEAPSPTIGKRSWPSGEPRPGDERLLDRRGAVPASRALCAFIWVNLPRSSAPLRHWRCQRALSPNEDGALPSWTFRPRVAVAEPVELWTARQHLRDGADENDP